MPHEKRPRRPSNPSGPPLLLVGWSRELSDRPCTACRATNNGRLFYVFVNHYVEDELVKRRVRICRDCVMELLPPLLEGADYWEKSEWLTADSASLGSTLISPAARAEVTLLENRNISTSTAVRRGARKQSA